ncbi:MAG: low temperature-induced protein [Parcubacteria group bacterium]
MKKITIGAFVVRSDAEKAIDQIHNNLGISNEEISYVYKDINGNTEEIDTRDITTSQTGEGAKTGAGVGGALGAVIGMVAVAGALPVVGPLVAAGQFAALLGLTGVAGGAAVGAVTGAATGGLVGALVGMGVEEEQAQKYADEIDLGNILVAVHAEEDKDVSNIMDKNGALDINVYSLQ